MEEILASIRKIISEDQQPEPAKAAPAPAAAKPAPQKMQPAPEPIAVAVAPAAAPLDLDVLELTEELPEDEPVMPVMPVRQAAPPPPPPPPPPIENDVIFESVAPPPAKELAMDDDLISDSTRHAVGRAFANLNGERSAAAPVGIGLEAVFVRAVEDALQHWVDGHSAEMMDNLKPLIRAWMDEHLPPLIEAAVAKEIARSAEMARKR